MVQLPNKKTFFLPVTIDMPNEICYGKATEKSMDIDLGSLNYFTKLFC